MKRFLKNVLIVMATLVAFYYLARFTYHQGWWGRDNLFARSMWLCSGPPELEESFYPDNVDVLVSACENQLGMSVLSDRIILFFSEYEWHYINLTTDKRSVFNSALSRYDIKLWISSDLILAWDNSDITRKHPVYYLFRPSTQEILLEIPYIDNIDDELVQGEETLNIPELVATLQDSKNVFVRDDTVLVLSTDYLQNTDKNFVFPASLLPLPVYDFLEQNKIEYSEGAQSYCSNNKIISPNNRFEARTDGIYSFPEDNHIVDFNLGEHPFYDYYQPCGWLPDESGVILNYGGSPYDHLSFGELHQPVLKFELPNEYIQ